MKRGREIVQERRVFERKFERVFRRALIEQALAVLKWDNFEGYETRVSLAVRKEPIERAMIELYQGTGAYFAAKTKVILTKADSDVWLEQMARYVRTKVAERITFITETTADQLKEMIRAALGEVTLDGGGISVSASAIQDALAKDFGEMVRWRALRIAQTETMTASNYASKEGAESLGIEMTKSWMVSGVNTRDSHYAAQADNQNIPMDQPFRVAGINCEYPGDPALPAGEVINCGCYVVYDPV